MATTTQNPRHYVSMGIRFLKNAYGVTTNQAQSIIAKTRFEIAKRGGATNVSNVYKNKEFGNINKLVYESLKGNYNMGIQTDIINGKPNVIFQKDVYGQDFSTLSDSFKSYTFQRMDAFIQKYIDVESFQKIYLDFFIDNKITYDEFKRQIEEFKRKDPAYLLIGS